MLAIAGGPAEACGSLCRSRALFPGTGQAVKQPSQVSSRIALRESALNDRPGASVYPVGLTTHTMSVNTPYHLPAYADFFFFS